MPHITFREKEDFSRVEHAPMWLLPCKTCGKPFRITSGQILGFVDNCPDCLDRQSKGLPPRSRTIDPRKLVTVAIALCGVTLACAAWLIYVLAF